MNILQGIDELQKEINSHRPLPPNILKQLIIDGNGRIARLLMNLILLQKSYCIAIIPPVLQVEYIQALEDMHTDDRNFIELIARVVKETQKDYLRLLK